MTLENRGEKESAITSVEEQRSYVKFNFSQLCRFTVSLPLVGLVICFVTANIFQQNDIHETHCRVSSTCFYDIHFIGVTMPNFFQVYNVIPSISSITGISPQRYIWRVCIAVHVGPRFLTSLVYHHFYLTMAAKVETAKRKNFIFHVWLAFALNLIEQAALIGVTYVSNRENYRKFKHSLRQKKNVICFSIYSNSRENIHHIHDQLAGSYAYCVTTFENG